MFGRDKKRHGDPSSAAPAGGNGELLDQVGQVIDDLADLALGSMDEGLVSNDMLALLQVGLPYIAQRDISDGAIIAGQTAARLGYLARCAEYAMFTSARDPDEELAEVLEGRLQAAERSGETVDDAVADLAADIAVSEPIDPSKEECTPSWTLPGIGGDLRGVLRDHLLSHGRWPHDVAQDDLQRTWKYGYFLRALEEFSLEEDEQFTL